MCWVLSYSSDFSLKILHPNLHLHLLKLLAKWFVPFDTPEPVNLLFVTDSQLKVIKTTVTPTLQHIYWSTLFPGSVLSVHQALRGEQSSKTKNRREKANGWWNRSEDWQQLHQCWQSHNFSSTKPAHMLVTCLGALVCEAAGHPGSQTRTLWQPFPIRLSQPSVTSFPKGLALPPYLLLLQQLHIQVILSSHPAGGWQSFPTVSTSGCCFSSLLLPVNPYSFFPD